MAKLYLDLHECGTVVSDDEGQDFPNLETARIKAVEAARGVMADEVLHGQLCLGCCIEIRDESGATVATILFRDVLKVTGLD